MLPMKKEKLNINLISTEKMNKNDKEEKQIVQRKMEGMKPGMSVITLNVIGPAQDHRMRF
jgi:hypothetical protein